ncbi:hypothetical protein [Candidatus Protochlamydia sp. R18]|uniref:hypothetical protein n=1 Tax=Candidatus Protochlamydia sp. R18 TaxID=1353977 RepID=UPI000A8D7774|nr:hypothetical protein [Candidatus Protochlamydia sp. R18]
MTYRCRIDPFETLDGFAASKFKQLRELTDAGLAHFKILADSLNLKIIKTFS